MTLQTAIDLSNYQGANITPLLEQYRPDHVIIRASTESDQHRQIARGQISAAIGAGIGYSIYIWAYFDLNPVEHTANALSVVDGFAPAYVFFDCEDGHPGGNLDNYLSQAVALAESRGKTCGIYTSANWWRANGDSAGFTRLPLWLANYNNQATLDDLDIPGNWPGVSGHQWTSDPIDQSVFSAGFFSAPDPCRALRESVAAELATINAAAGRIAALLAS